MLTDLDEAGLWQYRSAYKAPADFDEFWQRTLDEAAEVPLDVRIEPVETGLRTIDVYDVTFAGYAGHPVRAWLRLPRVAARERFRCRRAAVPDVASESALRHRPVPRLRQRTRARAGRPAVGQRRIRAPA